jgi:hypothetical protein
VSGTKHPELFAALAADFEKGEVKWRKQGPVEVPYISARTVANRLDNVVGPASWWDDYTTTGHTVVCTLTVRLPDGSIVSKQDAGGHAGMKDAGDDEKSAFSDSFKRAAVKFGIGRLLYGDGTPNFAPTPAQATTPAPTPAPATAKGPVDPDTRTLWELASDAAAKANDEYRKAIGDPDADSIADAASICGRLLQLAWEQGKGCPEPGPDMGTKALVLHAEELYANHRGWCRGELRRHLGEVLAEAKRAAGETREVSA